jgi:hypothetical integral membrane protein (TIGR02206 family)
MAVEHFWKTVEVIPDGIGFSHYGTLHLCWLVAFAVVTALNCILYRKLGEKGKKIWRITMAVLLVLDEIYKQIPLFVNGYFTLEYLPLHLCSINIFVIAFHAIKPTKIVGNFLYTVCIPGAMAALLFPTWNALPGANFMLIHSFTVHMLLAMYPIVLTVAGEIKPELKQVPKALLLLLGLAVIALVCNLLMNANFMFLMYADPGNPLYLFEELWGSHLLGFPVIIAGVLLVMHTPWAVARKPHK